MGRWTKRSPGLPREERIRLTLMGLALIEKIAAERSWLLNMDFDEPDYVEAVVHAGNPRLTEPLTLCCTAGGLAWWAESGGREWFEVDDAAACAAFARSIDEWVDGVTCGS